MFPAGTKIHVHLVVSWATSEISHTTFHLVGAPIYNSPLNRPLSNNDNENEVEILFGQPDNDNVNGTQYDMSYYLADRIYPEWAVFVNTVTAPQSEEDKLFALMQEGARK